MNKCRKNNNIFKKLKLKKEKRKKGGGELHRTVKVAEVYNNNKK